MESRTTPSLSFSMPGRMSATVRGRRGGGQIWLTERRTGFFIHRRGSWWAFLASDIAGSGPGAGPGGASRLGPPRGAPRSPPRGRHHLARGWAPDSGLPPERGAPPSEAPSFQGDLTAHIGPSGSSEHLLGGVLRIREGKKKSRPPLREEWNGLSP